MILSAMAEKLKRRSKDDLSYGGMWVMTV